MNKNIAETSIESEIKNITENLLGMLDLKADIEVQKCASEKDIKENDEEVDVFDITIGSEESGLLIGRHGETLNSLQLILGLILHKKLNRWVKLVVDVGGYRKAREESLKEMVLRISAEIKETGKAVTLPYLSPLERRFIHVLLSDNTELVSESEGVGKDRRLIIKPRN